MKNKIGILVAIAVFSLMALAFKGFRALCDDGNVCNPLLMKNVEALTSIEDGLPQLRWKTCHGICYRHVLENGVITLVPTSLIYGFSIADPNGSEEKHEHDCTFYCPDYH